MRNRINTLALLIIFFLPLSLSAKWLPDRYQASLGILAAVNSAQTRSFFNALHLDASWQMVPPWGVKIGYRPALRQSGSNKIYVKSQAHYLQTALDYRYQGDFLLWNAEIGPHMRFEQTRVGAAKKDAYQLSKWHPGLGAALGIGIPFAEHYFIGLGHDVALLAPVMEVQSNTRE